MNWMQAQLKRVDERRKEAQKGRKVVWTSEFIWLTPLYLELYWFATKYQWVWRIVKNHLPLVEGICHEVDKLRAFLIRHWPPLTVDDEGHAVFVFKKRRYVHFSGGAY